MHLNKSTYYTFCEARSPTLANYSCMSKTIACIHPISWQVLGVLSGYSTLRIHNLKCTISRRQLANRTNVMMVVDVVLVQWYSGAASYCFNGRVA